ncbi:unnamed protein product [Coregonus sp. 'balchen']|nr:unnamed protein product [Coregonus sp. 'balchen']
MDTWLGFSPGLHLTLCTWLLISAHTQLNAKAEISCSSCQSPVQLHLDELQLDTGMHAATGRRQAAKALERVRLEYQLLGVTDQHTGVPSETQQAGVPVDEPRFTDDGVTAKVALEDSTRFSENEETYGGEYIIGVNDLGKVKDGAGDVALRRVKRSGPDRPEFRESLRTGGPGLEGETSDERRSPGPLLDGHRLGRSEFKWNRDEGRGTSRGEDPKLSSTTFALTGDSAHNHAVVYWSGQNSSNALLVLPELCCALCHYSSRMTWVVVVLWCVLFPKAGCVL